MLWFLICVTAVVGVSFFCSLCEAAFMSLSSIRAETLRKEGGRNAQAMFSLKRDLGRTVVAILILNTVANTGGATFTGGVFEEVFGSDWLWLFSLGFTLAVLVVAEIVPKVIGATQSERVARAVSPLLIGLTRILRPLIALADLITRRLQRGRPAGEQVEIGDLATLAKLARRGAVIDRKQEEIIVNAARLTELTARDVMIARDQIAFLRLDAEPEANRQVARTSLHTRYPVASTVDVDTLTGYVNFKEIMSAAGEASAFGIRHFLRPLIGVDPETSANDLLALLTQRRGHIAVVREAGRVHGMVTLEDVLEEIVGELEDEFDWVSAEVVEVCPNAWRVGGAAKLDDLAQVVAMPGLGESGQLTMHEWLSPKLPSPPRLQMVYVFGDVKFYLHQVRRKRIVELVVEGRSRGRKG